MRLFKEKASGIKEINDQFLEQTLHGSKKLQKAISAFANKTSIEDSLDDVIESERICDRLKEKYIQILYKNKRALPFLVEDRYQILNLIDQINDKTEFIARFMKIFPFELYEDIKKPFKELCNNCAIIVENLIECAHLVENDFDGAYKVTFKVEESRRIARSVKFDLLKVLYQKKDDPVKIYLTSKLVTYIYDIASWAEEISDYLRGLIIKYPSR
jgi:predicted phosphate transport protein (TIGR00153 family)